MRHTDRSPMLPRNPVVIPLYADPCIWTIALLSLVAEVAVVRQAFVRRGAPRDAATRRLALINLASWGAFLVRGSMERRRPRPGRGTRALGRRRRGGALRGLVAPLVPAGPRPPWRWLLGWSLLGNATSAALCALLVTAGAIATGALQGT